MVTHLQCTKALIWHNKCTSKIPDEITPEGMTQQRREYLHKNIRQYCKEEFKDTFCPQVEPEQATEAMAEIPFVERGFNHDVKRSKEEWTLSE
ncbi:hypothetical protein J6590_079995 [Homalodisca vitripennis]|nr:hypothetical protein J6590_079995 [Homalodisca vitripennis]